MLSSILRVMYINPEWAAREYLTRSKSDTWKQANDDESLKCWNLERILEAEQFGEVKKTDLRMDELLGELEEDDQGREKVLVVQSTTLYVNVIGMGDVQTDVTQLSGTPITSRSLI